MQERKKDGKGGRKEGKWQKRVQDKEWKAMERRRKERNEGRKEVEGRKKEKVQNIFCFYISLYFKEGDRRKWNQRKGKGRKKEQHICLLISL